MARPDLDLDLQESGLALDLVAEWQLDQIKNQELWEEWNSCSSVDPDVPYKMSSYSPFYSEPLGKEMVPEEYDLLPGHGVGPYVIRVVKLELIMAYDDFHLVAWGNPGARWATLH